MGKSYSEDIRFLVVELFIEGENIEEIIEKFKIAKSTIYKWHLQYKKFGHLSNKKYTTPIKKIKNEELELIVRSEPDLTLLEIAKKLNVSKTGIFDALKRLGYSKKKDYNLQRIRS